MLTVAVMAILITAPLGAILIMLTGPRLLARDVPEEGEEVHEHEMQTMPETELDQSPLSLARFKAAQHHGSQQLIKARRYSCLWLIMFCWRNYIFSLPIINFVSSSLRKSMLLALIRREPQDLIGFFGARVSFSSHFEPLTGVEATESCVYVFCLLLLLVGSTIPHMWRGISRNL